MRSPKFNVIHPAFLWVLYRAAANRLITAAEARPGYSRSGCVIAISHNIRRRRVFTGGPVCRPDDDVMQMSNVRDSRPQGEKIVSENLC